jgi:hypothetical protein
MTSAQSPLTAHEAANPRAAARSVIPTGRAPIAEPERLRVSGVCSSCNSAAEASQ